MEGFLEWGGRIVKIEMIAGGGGGGRENTNTTKNWGMLRLLFFKRWLYGGI